MIDARELMGDFIFTDKYSRFLKHQNRREEYVEAGRRMRDMHIRKYVHASWPAVPDDYSNPILNEIIAAFSFFEEKKLLASQRALQFGGAAMEQHNMRGYNCLDVTTQFITTEGVKSFKDFKDGDEIEVLTHKGRFMPAVVKSFGIQELQKIEITRKAAKHEVWATKDHRWFLTDKSITTALKTGDRVLHAPNIAKEFDYDSADVDEKLYWTYGYVFGDGTKVKKKGEYAHSLVRLCKNDSLRYRERFEELGFKTSTSHSLQGDFIAYTGKYLKTIPKTTDSPSLIRAWVHGYLAADGAKNLNFERSSNNQYYSIQCSNPEGIEAIRTLFPLAGFYIVSEKELTGQETNFGIRPYTVSFRIANDFGPNNVFVANVTEERKTEQVWCLEVEEDESFVLPFGVVTGNCSASYCDRPRFFAEAFYMLLCGSGVGFSVQKKHVANLPDLIDSETLNTRKKRIFIIPDTIEGWADSLNELINSFIPSDPGQSYLGVTFNYSQIRPKGSSLSTGGKAPGPDPLRIALERIERVLERAVYREEGRLRPVDCHDIVTHMADAVLSGGVRRAACISLFNVNDEEMMNCKTGNWINENPQRARANNSAVLLRSRRDKTPFSKCFRATKEFGDPGFFFTAHWDYIPNPCQPSWAPVITRKGIQTIGDISIGDEIWSETGWTKVINKWSTGIKPVYQYRTSASVFYGTENHRVVSDGVKIEAQHAESIDTLVGPFRKASFNSQDVLDGLMIGDGTYHKAGNRCYLNIGENDKDYFHSDISSLIGDSYGSNRAFKVLTSITPEELGNLWERRIPTRYLDKDRIASFLRGLYSANGSVTGDRVTLKTTSRSLVEDVQLALSSLGIRSYFTTNHSKTVRFSNGEYECKESYDVNTTDRVAFLSTIGFLQEYKNSKLRTIIESKKEVKRKTTFDIIHKSFVSEEEVFDITVDNDTHTYWSGGCNVSNCGEILMCPQLILDPSGNVVEEYTLDLLTAKTHYRNLGYKYHSGWQTCNLVTINMARITSKEEYKRVVRAAAIIGTLQAGWTDTGYLGRTSQRILEREALLGISMTGMMENPDIAFDYDLQKEMAEYAVEVNKEWAKLIGIKPAARVTAIKPEGTGSLVLRVTSGVSAEFSKKYIRRVQSNKINPVYNYFKSINPHMCEPSVWNSNTRDEVISFPIEAKPKAIVKEDLSALEFLEKVRNTQQSWVKHGTARPMSCEGATHNVSNTCDVRTEEWDDVEHFIYENKDSFAGVTFMPVEGDYIYPQAPYQKVYSNEELIAKYGQDVFDEAYKIAHMQGRTLVDLSAEVDFVLKALEVQYEWDRLQKDMKFVDYRHLVEETDETELQDTVACGGGVCLL